MLSFHFDHLGCSWLGNQAVGICTAISWLLGRMQSPVGMVPGHVKGQGWSHPERRGRKLSQSNSHWRWLKRFLTCFGCPLEVMSLLYSFLFFWWNSTVASDCLCRDVRGGQFRHTGCGCQPNTVGVILSYQSAGINTSCMECLPRLVSISTKSSLESLGTCFMIYESWHQRLKKKAFPENSICTQRQFFQYSP